MFKIMAVMPFTFLATLCAPEDEAIVAPKAAASGMCEPGYEWMDTTVHLDNSESTVDVHFQVYINGEEIDIITLPGSEDKLYGEDQAYYGYVTHDEAWVTVIADHTNVLVDETLHNTCN